MKLLVDNQLVTLAELRRAWLDHVTVELGDQCPAACCRIQ